MNKAYIEVEYDTLAKMLQLPKNIKINSVGVIRKKNSIVVILESNSFMPTPKGGELLRYNPPIKEMTVLCTDWK